MVEKGGAEKGKVDKSSFGKVFFFLLDIFTSQDRQKEEKFASHDGHREDRLTSSKKRGRVQEIQYFGLWRQFSFKINTFLEKYICKIRYF